MPKSIPVVFDQEQIDDLKAYVDSICQPALHAIGVAHDQLRTARAALIVIETSSSCGFSVDQARRARQQMEREASS